MSHLFYFTKNTYHFTKTLIALLFVVKNFPKQNQKLNTTEDQCNAQGAWAQQQKSARFVHFNFWKI